MPSDRSDSAHVAALLAQSPYVKLCQERHDRQVLDLLTEVEAWENLVLPLRRTMEGVLFATTREALPGAVALLQRRLGEPFRFVLADLHLLEQFIAERYDFEGVPVEEAA